MLVWRLRGWLARSAGAGHPCALPSSKLRKKLLHAGQAPKEVARVVSVSLATVYRHLPASERQADPLAARWYQLTESERGIEKTKG